MMLNKNLINEYNTSISNQENSIRKLKHLIRKEYEKADVCPECKGDKVVLQIIQSHHGQHRVFEPCYSCLGTGIYRE